MIYKSQKDKWLVGVLYLIILVLWGFAFYSVFKVEKPLQNHVMDFIMAVFGTSILYMRYTIKDGLLIIQAGPFVWRVKISDIERIERSDSSFSAPALSLNRTKVVYSKNNRMKSIVISPKKKDAFLKDLKDNGFTGVTM